MLDFAAQLQFSLLQPLQKIWEAALEPEMTETSADLESPGTEQDKSGVSWTL